MKILHIIPNMEVGGAQRLLAELLPLMKKDGNEIKLIIFHRNESFLEKELQKKDIEIINLKGGNRSLKVIKKLRPYLKWADLAHAHLFPTGYFLSLANIGINKPIFYTEHSTYNKRRNYPLLQPIEWAIYNSMNVTISISKATQNNLLNWLKIKNPGKKFITIGNGINLNAFKKAPVIEAKELFGREGIPILMISRLEKSKDHSTLVRALSLVDNPNAFLVFVGEGSEKDSIQNLINKLGLSERIIFMGNRNDIPELIKASYIGVQSSHWEGFGLTAVEMMAGGLPVIASDVIGLREVVTGAGFIFPHENYEVLAQIINRLIEDKQLYKEAQQRSIQRSEEFSIDLMADQYLTLYKEFT